MRESSGIGFHHTSTAYRPEIDGLRAVAVVAVMLFHAGITPFSGGYVGVDVFFVISGYLITTIMLAEKQAGTFTFADFYERRARRILPALFLVALTCLPLAWLWLLPPDMMDFSQSLLALLGFGSNVYFWRASGYFASEAELSPLLHTWSLAVEEQYYLIYPWLVWLLWRVERRRLVLAIATAALLSFALAQWASTNRPAANFFLLPTRAWEILLGALCAFSARNEPVGTQARLLTECLCALGCMLIATAVLAFDERTPTPGLYTLLPTVGTAFVIVFGARTRIAAALGSRPLVALGLVSYSAYLWHQPLYAFVRHRALDEPSKWLLALMGLAACLLGALSWRLVEAPFRNKHRIGRRVFVASALSVMAVLLTFSVASHLDAGFESRLSPEQRTIVAYTHYPYAGLYEEGVCFLASDQPYTTFSDRCRGNTVKDTVLVWGDSYAAALAVGLRKTLVDTARYAASGCPPFIDYQRSANRNCVEVNRFVLAQMSSVRPAWVVLHANWLHYRDAVPAEQIKQTVAEIRMRSPTSRVLVVGAVPQWYTGLPSLMLKSSTPLTEGQFLKSQGSPEFKKIEEMFEISAQNSEINFISALDILCSAGRCRATALNSGVVELTAWDSGHLTSVGSLLLAQAVAGRLN